jgi:hypothetical protein
MGRFVNPDSSAFQVALNSRIIQWFLAKCDDADKVVPFITKSVFDELRDSYPEVLPHDEGRITMEKNSSKRVISRFLYLVF